MPILRKHDKQCLKKHFSVQRSEKDGISVFFVDPRGKGSTHHEANVNDKKFWSLEEHHEVVKNR